MANSEQTVSIKVNVDLSDAIKQIAMLLEHLVAIQEGRDDLTGVTVTSETAIDVAITEYLDDALDPFTGDGVR